MAASEEFDTLRARVNQEGFYLMDEPDAPLSFVASLGLAALLHDLAVAGSQVRDPHSYFRHLFAEL